jgi:hypothetical protein
MGVRRELRFKTLKEARAELDRLEKGPVVTTGGWTFYQILEHLRKGVASSTASFHKLGAWWLRRLVGPVALYVIFKLGYIKPGTGVKKGVKIERVEGDEKAALAALRKALDDLEKHNGPWGEHPLFGKMNQGKWHLLTSIHFANHLGWAKLKDE